MDRGGLDAGADEVLHDLVGAVLGAGEDEHALHRRIGEQRLAAAAACSAVATNITLCSTRSTVVATGVDRDLHRVGEERSASCAIVFGMVAEKNSVCRFAGHELHDPPERHDEAEVEHLVGLVDDEDLDRAERQQPLLDQVEQPARRGDEDVDAAAQRVDLRALRDAAEDDGGLQRQAARRRCESSRAIWLASSRVGVSTSTRGRAARGVRPALARRCRIGSAKAAVLPVPVWAMPQRSRPARTEGMACAWIGVGVV